MSPVNFHKIPQEVQNWTDIFTDKIYYVLPYLSNFELFRWIIIISEYFLLLTHVDYLWWYLLCILLLVLLYDCYCWNVVMIAVRFINVYMYVGHGRWSWQEVILVMDLTWTLYGRVLMYVSLSQNKGWNMSTR